MDSFDKILEEYEKELSSYMAERYRKTRAIQALKDESREERSYLE